MKSNREVLGILKTLDKLNKDYEKNRLRIFSSNRIHNSKFVFFRYIVSCEELKKYSLRDIFINYFNKAESFFPGSSYDLSKEIVSRFFSNKSFLKNNIQVKNSVKNLDSFLNQFSSKETVNLFNDILKLSGPDSSIKCNPYKGSNILISKKNSSRFNVCIEESFINIYFNKVSQSTKTAQICVMDAFIERESELVPLIDYANKNKLPVVVFCRGFSRNAIESLKRIILKNNIFVYPYSIKFDNSDPFVLKDLASALNLSLLSSESGDSIYKDIVKKSGTKEIKLSSNFIEIKKPNTDEIANINKVLKNTNDSNLKKYLIKRKTRFISKNTDVFIPENEIEKLTEIKNLIRCYNHVAAFGLVKINDRLYSKSSVENIYILSERMYSTLNSIGFVVANKKKELV